MCIRDSASTGWRQLLRQVGFDAFGVFRSAPFLVLLVLGMANFIPTALHRRTMYGTPSWPVTSQMLEALQGSFSFLLIIIVLFYAGELVWRERSARIAGISDAMPVPNWVPLLGKFLTLIAVVLAFQAVGGLTAIAIQLSLSLIHI